MCHTKRSLDRGRVGWVWSIVVLLCDLFLLLSRSLFSNGYFRTIHWPTVSLSAQDHIRIWTVLIFVLYCRKMAKRVADTYLTDQNWDKEQPEEQVKCFLLFRNCLRVCCFANMLWVFPACWLDPVIGKQGFLVFAWKRWGLQALSLTTRTAWGQKLWPGARKSLAFYACKQLLLSARLSHRNSVHPTVCLSVTRVDQSKMVQDMITKSSPSAAWKTLVSGTVKLFHKFEGGHLERGR